MTSLRVLCGGFVCAFMLALPVAGQVQPAATPGIRVTGEVGKPGTLDLLTLQSLPQVTVGLAGKHYTGPRLWDVLTATGLAPASGHRNPALSMYVVARGEDGYQALLALAETDPAINNREVIVAHSVNGQLLDAAAGPARLVVSGDSKPSRSVFRLTHLHVATAP